MIVYRIEHPLSGQGPYTHDEGQYRDLVINLPSFDYPEPYTDCQSVCMTPEKRVGCLSLDRLFDWFADALDSLTLEGFQLSVYCVPNASLVGGTFQCVFEKSEAIFLDSHPPNGILEMLTIQYHELPVPCPLDPIKSGDLEFVR